ncbi:glycosyl hydrolase [Limibacter armeniacum]|uniref:glycoside hydrolase family 26 protein n=1 Tax=Limibacter armeniacum TaxID=466084 RepID=UPI002FE64690
MQKKFEQRTAHTWQKWVAIGLLSSGLLYANGTMAQNASLVDTEASKKTGYLYDQMHLLSGKGLMLGHQDDTSYGVNWWDMSVSKGFGKWRKNQPSDTKRSIGVYPAVYGWDLGHIGEPNNLDKVPFEKVRENIIKAYRRGGINTVSWHMKNLKTGSSSWDTTQVVKDMLPGGTLHGKFKEKLDLVADFLHSLNYWGEPIPVLFRPWHEMTGKWFWWGEGNCTTEEYKALYKFTVEYLRDVKQVHNLIYVYSTDRFDSEETYLKYYPGDAYVDVLGFDDYHSLKPENSASGPTLFAKEVQIVVKLAKEKGKLSAMTETGLIGLPDTTWFSQSLLSNIMKSEEGKQLSYVLVWRNANIEHDRPDHFCVPHEGHPSVADFKEFYQSPFTLFEDQLPDMYKKVKGKDNQNGKDKQADAVVQ